MPRKATLELARKYLFTDRSELSEVMDQQSADRIVRLREMYAWVLDNPSRTDADFVREVVSRHSLSRPQAYSDLSILKTIMPKYHTASKEFHRFRALEMQLETYNKAKAKGDTRTMERAATSYANISGATHPDEETPQFDMIVVQPFVPTTDPRTLGLEPIPNLQNRIKQLLEKYSADSADILDVDYEEADLEEDGLFGDNKPDDEQAGLL